jgi:glycosyltransferase involved in cell wall biosynthesis
MKIAIVRAFPNVLAESGYNIQEFGLARGLVGQGVSVDVMLAGDVDTPLLTQRMSVNGAVFNEIRLPFINVLGSFALYPHLKKILRENRYDLIQCEGYEQIILWTITRWGVKKRVPVVVHDGIYKIGEWGRMINGAVWLLQKTVGRYARKHAPRAIAKTEMARQRLLGQGFKSVEAIPIGLDIGKFTNSRTVVWRERLGLSEATKIILYVGIIEQRRNVDFLIRVIERVRHREPNVCMVVVGEGPQRESCEELVAQFGLKKHVVFTGRVPQDELPSLYQSSELFVLPSDSEIVGMVMLESLHFGTPVLASKTAGSLDIVDERCGVVFDSLDEEQWADAEVAILDKQPGYDFKALLRTDPFKRSWDDLAPRYKCFYQELIDTQRT